MYVENASKNNVHNVAVEYIVATWVALSSLVVVFVLKHAFFSNGYSVLHVHVG